ncbi:MAG: hypothetical protein LQ346_007840 [Caloplaca aetnensis]|nr:MAG: hypothetical protein LQ346_007840 [Caloplaca aetnensis]
MLSSTLFKALFPLLAATLTSALCDRTCDTLYFAGVSPPSYTSHSSPTTPTTYTKTILTNPLPTQYDDLASGTVLTFANPYLGIQYSGYTVRDFTGNGVLTIPSGPNALIAYNPTLTLPVNRLTLTVYRPEIEILDPESAFLACVTVNKDTKQILAPVECYVRVRGTGPNYYIVEDIWHFTPTAKKTSQLQLFNLGDNFNSINTIELELVNVTAAAKLKRNQEYAIVLDEFTYGGRLSG